MPTRYELTLSMQIPLEATWTAYPVTDIAFTDRQVVIRILEDDYSFTDDHYGLASHSLRKLRAPVPPPLPALSVTRSTALEPPGVGSPIPTVLSQPICPAVPSPLVHTEEVTIKFTALLGPCSNLACSRNLSLLSFLYSCRTSWYHIRRSYYWSIFAVLETPSGNARRQTHGPPRLSRCLPSRGPGRPCSRFVQAKVLGCTGERGGDSSIS